MRKFYLLLCLLISVISPLAAQEGTPEAYQLQDDFEINIGTTFTSEWAWSADSQSLSYFDPTQVQDAASFPSVPTVNLPEPVWNSIDIASRTISQNSTWPLQATIGDTLSSAWNPTAFIYGSSSSDFVIFTNETEDNEVLVIGNIDLGTFITTGVSTVYNNRPEEFRVLWSEFYPNIAIQTLDIYGGWSIYFINLETGLSQNFILILDDLLYHNFDHLYDRLYDIDGEGAKVLLVGRLDVGEISEAPTYLIIWTPNNPESSNILVQFDGYQTRAAAFSPQNSSQLLILNDSGLILYDEASNTTTILRNDFSLADISHAEFSPNGEWLAIQIAETIHFIYIPALLDS